MSNLLSLTSAQLNQAATLKDKITALEKQLAGLLGGSAPTTVKAKLGRPPNKSKGMSAAGRAKIAAAQKARWAKINAGKPAAKAAQPAVKKKRTMSAAGRARIAAAAKLRWANAKAAGKNTL
jgi:hypothetical protein